MLLFFGPGDTTLAYFSLKSTKIHCVVCLRSNHLRIAETVQHIVGRAAYVACQIISSIPQQHNSSRPMPGIRSVFVHAEPKKQARLH